MVFYPINETMFAFRFQSFKFQGDFDYLYLQCKAFVCGLHEKDDQCDRTCNYGDRRRRRDLRGDVRRRRDVTFEFGIREYDVEEGPIVIIDPAVSRSSTTSALMSSSVSSSTTRSTSSPGSDHGGTVTPKIAPELPHPSNKVPQKGKT